MELNETFFNQHLMQIHENDSSEDSQELIKLLDRLDEIIRQNESIRKTIDDFFYKVMLQKLQKLIAYEDQSKWCTLSLVLKCVKNSAGIHRKGLCESEQLLCDFLNDRLFLDLNNQLQLIENDVNIFKTFIYSLQYIFNLIQGK